MKRILYTISTVSAATLLLLSSCTKKVDEAYANPNATVRVPIETLLPGIIGNLTGSASAAGSSYGTSFDGMHVGRYIQYWENNAAGGSQFDMMGGSTGASDLLGNVWAMHYYGMGQNLNKVMLWGEEEKKWDYVGVAYALRAWSWLTLTDFHGEVILKEAFNTSLLTFKYDDQAEVYAEARRVAHIALEYLGKTGDGVSQTNLAIGDQYFYKGDVVKWKKFVYSVLARSFHHLTNKASYNMDSVIYYANLGIISNADNATATFANTGISGTANFYGPLRNNMGSLRQSRFVANLMTGLNPMFLTVIDPRTPYLLRENTNGTYKGIRPNKGSDGLAAADQPQNFWGGTFGTTTASNDNASRYIFKNAAPLPIIAAAEMHFMKAEAYLRKDKKVEARASYIDGINASFDLLTGTPDYHNTVPVAMQITPASRAAFLAHPLVVPPAAFLTLSHIMLQKFIALYGFGHLETWVDMRRYHYTDLDPVTGLQVYADFTPPSGLDLYTNNNGKLVYRARPRYNSEYLYNVAELQRIGAISLDYHTKEQWFSMP